jgi:hypothetical protein
MAQRRCGPASCCAFGWGIRCNCAHPPRPSPRRPRRTNRTSALLTGLWIREGPATVDKEFVQRGGSSSPSRSGPGLRVFRSRQGPGRSVERANDGDAAGIADLYEEDAVMAYPPGSQTAGRDAVRALWEKVLAKRHPWQKSPCRRCTAAAIRSDSLVEASTKGADTVRRCGHEVLAVDLRQPADVGGLRPRGDDGAAHQSRQTEDQVGPYQLQAAIAAIHDEAARAEDTDWLQILALYRMLEQIAPNPMVTLNCAIAVAMVHGPRAGLAALEPLDADTRIARHHRLYAVRARLFEMAGDRDAAHAAYLAAARATTSLPERRYLQTKAAALISSNRQTSRPGSHHG